MMAKTVYLLAILQSLGAAWTSISLIHRPTKFSRPSTGIKAQQTVTRHGENACFLPLKQNGQDDYAPRIVQIAGAYPGITKADFMAVTAEPAPDVGQWKYDFSDPEGPQLGTVALQGSELLHYVQEPVAIITEHTELGIQLPEVIKDGVDLIVLVDRAEKGFAERKFVLVNIPGQEELLIAAFPSKKDLPEGAEILGRIKMVQIPWLPGMAPTRTGFAEADEYFTA